MISELQKTKLIPEAIAAYFDRTGVNGAQLSRLSKVGEAYTNHIINGKTKVTNDSKQGFTNIKDRYYHQICDTIGYKIEGEKKAWKHFNTENFKAIITQIKDVREAKGRGTVDGDTGAGKSHALAMYLKAFPINTFVVKCYADENSKEFAINIAEVVGVETHGTAGTITKRVCKKLLSLDDAILIIDESEHIKNKSGYINIVKSIADRLEGVVPFLLSGMDINEILQRYADKHKQNFRQSARRFSKRMKCDIDIAEDIEKIATEFEFSKSCITWLQNRIKNFGELEIIITAALKESELLGKPVSVELLNSLYNG